ncbi:MAG: helix-turn-helix transcriptional regulator [Oligoflexia bacterium]|nr:helix-turn-helix transcriptional regulator [Oligoflexia bacterium]
MVDARRADGSRICAGNCVNELDHVGQHDYSAVHAKGGSYRLVCTAAGDMRVITLIPVDDQAVSLGTLTSRERQVLSLVAKGNTNPRIATTLSLSASTVRTHMEHILAKLGVQTRAAAAARAIAAGLISG